MYLSRLILNPRSRQVQRELANRYELHRTVLSAFPNPLPADERVLYRLEVAPSSGISTLLVQSLGEPAWEKLAAAHPDYLLPQVQIPGGLPNPACKRVALQLHRGQLLGFRLRANPAVKRVCEGLRQGKRVGLYGEEDQIEWLRQRLERAGASLLDVQVSEASKERATALRGREGVGGQPGEQSREMVFAVGLFDGILRVEEPDRLLEHVRRGIGSGKGFGFGLMSLRRLR